MAKDSNKAMGIINVAKALQIELANVMAVGDAQNDIEMLKQVKIGVAMENAMDEVKKVSDLVTKSNDENGIGIVIDALLEGTLSL